MVTFHNWLGIGWWIYNNRKAKSMAQQTYFWMDHPASMPLVNGNEHGAVYHRVHSYECRWTAADAARQWEAEGMCTSQDWFVTV